ncbi:MAG: 23S rRNA (pseudouridine(1915)-N(3))-methyltransferase RlmH [Nitrospirae bacterium]|nr:23S rRNA (pseudouridine(1915)-N(3))-methyltransferase RlmH [Nitrospirota bacterium]
MKINLIWAGKTKEQFLLDGIRKYEKLLKPYAHIAVHEIKEEKGTDIQRMVEKEGERILKCRSPYVLLDDKGKHLTSVEFAGFIVKNMPEITFVIGGAYGVSDRVKQGAQDRIALSRMTFTHEMTRLVLLEQLFRAFTIIHKRSYHH